MIIETTLVGPEGILPSSLLKTISQLQKGGLSDPQVIIEKIAQMSNEDQRIFALLYLYEKANLSRSQYIQIYRSFLSDDDANIRYHVAIYLGIFGAKEAVPQLNKLMDDDQEFVQAASLWSLAKITKNQQELREDIQTELLQAHQDDWSRVLLGAALYQLNDAKNSQEMQALESFFREEYYDSQEEHYYEEVLLGKYGLSAELIAAILWEAGIKIITNTLLKDHDLQWLLSKE